MVLGAGGEKERVASVRKLKRKKSTNPAAKSDKANSLKGKGGSQ